MSVTRSFLTDLNLPGASGLHLQDAAVTRLTGEAVAASQISRPRKCRDGAGLPLALDKQLLNE